MTYLLKNYIGFKKILESDSRKVSYFTVTEKQYRDTNPIQIELIKRFFSKFSNCKIEKIEKSPANNFFTILLSVNQEDLGFLGDTGMVEETLELRVSPIEFSRTFKDIFVSSNELGAKVNLTDTEFTILLNENFLNLSDAELLKICIKNINIDHSFRYYTKPNEKVEVVTPEKIDQVLFSQNRDPKLITTLNRDLTYSINKEFYNSEYPQYFISTSRKTIDLDDYSQNVSRKVKSLEEKSLGLKNFTEEERNEFIDEAVDLQKFLSKSCVPGFAENRISSNALFKLYDLLETGGISHTEIKQAFSRSK